METVGAYTAKTKLAELLRRAEAGETIAITRNGRTVAKLVPADTPRRQAMRQALDDLRRLRSGVTLGSELTVRDLIDEGRRH